MQFYIQEKEMKHKAEDHMLPIKFENQTQKKNTYFMKLKFLRRNINKLEREMDRMARLLSRMRVTMTETGEGR